MEFKQITARLSGQKRHCFSDWLYPGRTSLNPFPHIDAFWRLCSRRRLKTLWQEEKYHIISFFFCHDFFNFIQLLYFRLHIFVKVLSRCLKVVCFRYVVYLITSCCMPLLTIVQFYHVVSKLLLVHLSLYQPVRRNANQMNWAPRRATVTTAFSLTWARSAQGELLWSPIVRRPSSDNLFSSVTNGSVGMKLPRKHPFNDITRIPSNVWDPCRILVSMATKRQKLQ